MPKHTSVSPGDHFAGFVDRQLSSGRYGSTSEVIRAGLRMLEEREARVQSLRNALVEGEASGDAQPFSFQAFLDRKKRGSHKA